MKCFSFSPFRPLSFLTLPKNLAMGIWGVLQAAIGRCEEKNVEMRSNYA